MALNRGTLLRYPGGKGRMLDYLQFQLRREILMADRLVEPFVGGGSFFFSVGPKRALLADLNRELIDLYLGIRRDPGKVWRIFNSFPSTRRAYYRVRGMCHAELELPKRAARTLYLNRTCFKGMWRHNAAGEFNIGYGGQDRRWVIDRKMLFEASHRLRHARLVCLDFEETLGRCREGDFVFLDPPYRPGHREMLHDHYGYGRFTYEEHKRLYRALSTAARRGVRWAMTTTGHPSIVRLFRRFHVCRIPRGTGKGIGRSSLNSGEVLICNFRRVQQ